LIGLLVNPLHTDDLTEPVAFTTERSHPLTEWI